MAVAVLDGAVCRLGRTALMPSLSLSGTACGLGMQKVNGIALVVMSYKRASPFLLLIAARVSGCARNRSIAGLTESGASIRIQ